MTKSETLYSFFNSLGLDAYPSNSVPDDVVFPWLTYENNLGNVGDEVSCAVKLFYHTDSEKTPNDKADEIAEIIGLGGKILDFDGGRIWVKRGNPWCQQITDENDTAIKGRLITLSLEYL